MKKFSIIILSIFLPLVFAVPVLAQQNLQSGESITLPRNQTINSDYFAAGDSVTVSGTVNGDAYVAGGNVLIDGTINGDLLVAGGNVTIRGTVTQDIRSAGGTVIISSDVGGNVTILAGSGNITDSASITGSVTSGVGNLEIFAPIGKGLTLGAGTATIGNSVGGDIAAGVSELTLTSDASIAGNLTYWSDREIRLASDSSVSGTIIQHTPPQGTTESTEQAAEGVFQALSVGVTLASFLSALVVGLLLIKFTPKFMETVADSVLAAPAKNILIGFIALIVVPIAALFLLATLLLIPLSVLVMVLYFVAIYFSKIFVAYAIGKKAAGIFNVTWARGVVFLAGLILFYLATAIPVFGWILSFVAMILGIGALFSSKATYYKTLKEKKIL